MICFSMDPFFDFTIYGMQVCHVLIPYLDLHRSFILVGENKKGKYCLGKEIIKLSDSRGSFEELSLDFKIFSKDNLQMDRKSMNK